MNSEPELVEAGTQPLSKIPPEPSTEPSRTASFGPTELVGLTGPPPVILALSAPACRGTVVVPRAFSPVRLL